MSEGAKTGLASAVERAIEAAPAPERAVQLPLMPADQLDQLPTGPVDRQAAIKAPVRGRPPGSVNKRTAAMAEYLLARYRSPLIGLAEIFSRRVQDLAAELDCSKLDAFKLQVQAMGELAPYLHGKMPVQVDLGGALPVLHLVPPAAAAAAFQAGPDGVPRFDPSKIVLPEENQSLIEGSARQVGHDQSDSSEIAEADQQLSQGGPLIGDQQA